MNTINTIPTNNVVTVTPTQNNTIVITDSDQNQVTVTQPLVSVIEVNVPGPQGRQGTPGTISDTGSFATTGSNNFKGVQNILGSVSVTGSLIVSGSNTFKNIGPAEFTGSVTTQGTVKIITTDPSFPAVWVSSSNINDGVGAFRADSTEPDIYLNDTDGGWATVTFANQDDPKVAFGRDSDDNFYITRNTESVWWDDTFVISRQTGQLSLGYGLNVDGGITGSLFGTASYSNQALTSSYAVTASYILGQSATASYAISASQAVSSSFALTASYAINTQNIDTGSLTTTASFNQFTSSYKADSASFDVRIVSNSSSIQGLSSSYAVSSASFDTRITTLSSSLYNLSSSYLTFSSSYNTGSFTGSFNGDGSGLYNIPSSGIVGLNLNQISSGSVSASISPDTGFGVNTNTNIQGVLTASSALINGNLTVLGTASFVYTTESIVQVGASTITLNTNYPATRFGGINVVDSGSFGNSSTGSMLWDSLFNRWIYTNPSGSSYDGGMLISGPRNTSGLGNEQGTTLNAILKGQGGDHLTSSAMFEVSGSVGIGTSTPSASLHVVGTTTATSSIARGVYFNNTLSASANNDILTGLDITPTFSTGSFTGVTQYGLRISGSILNNVGGGSFYTSNILGASYISLHAATPTTSNYFIRNNGFSTLVNTSTGDLYFNLTNVTMGRFFNSTGNFTLQNGGTFTDNGYKLDVSGSGRFSGNLTITGSATNSLLVKGSGTTSATTALLVQNANASSSLILTDDGTLTNIISGSSYTAFETFLDTAGSGIRLRRISDGLLGRIIYDATYKFPDNGGAMLFGASTSGLSHASGIVTLRATQPQITLQSNTNSGKGFFVTAPTASNSLELWLHDNFNQQNRRLVLGYSNTSDLSLYQSGSTSTLLFISQSGQVILSGSLIVTGGITGSFSGSGIITSASFASTASYVNPLIQSVSIKGTGTTSATTALLIQNANTSASLSVLDNGTVGIGTSSPTAQLTIQGTGASNATSNLLIRNSSGSVVFQTFDNLTWSSVAGNVNTQANGQLNAFYLSAGLDLSWGRNGVGNNLLLGSGTINASARLQVDSTTTGFLPPRTNLTANISSPAQGLITYLTGSTNEGLYYYNSGSIKSWTRVLNDTGSQIIATGSLSVGTTSTVSALTIYKSGSTVMSIQGSQGELFSITDSLSGSLFSVSNISGLPIVETFSDNTTLMGNYLAPMLITTQKLTVNSGSTVIYSLPTSSYDGAFFEYTIRSGSNARAGQIMGIWSGSSVNFTDNSTTDFGSTSGFIFGMIITGSNMVLTGSASTSGWTLKTIIRSI